MTRIVRRISVAVLFTVAVLLSAGSSAQEAQRAPVNQSDNPLLKQFRWRSIGPANMGGRIDDIAVVESNPSIYYVGFATGGVWKTVNNGTTWTPIFDTYPVASVGVKDTQTIARIVIDPKDPDIVYVAALGHLFGPNEERGIFKTIDGGKTWNKVKYVDQDTGFTDLVMDPRDSRVLYAASYQRRRAIWGFNGGGPGSGIWKTTDAGRTWTRLQGNGLPEGPFGRIGLDVSRSKPNVVYAQIEVNRSGGPGAPPAPEGPPGAQQPPVPQQPPQQPQPPDLKRHGVWRSDDAGKTWRLMSNNNNRPMYYSQIRVDPTNDQIVYTMGAPFHKSIDGGKTFNVVPGIAHGDHHALWINPRHGNHLVLGNDGGLDVSYDQAATWEHINTMAVGQFYAIAADLRAVRTTSAAGCRTTAASAGRARSARLVRSSTPTGTASAAVTACSPNSIRPTTRRCTSSRKTAT